MFRATHSIPWTAAASLVLALALSAPVAAQAVGAPVVSMMTSLCSSTRVSLDQRLTALSDAWRTANDDEVPGISATLARATTVMLVVSGGAEPEQADAAAEAFEQRIAARRAAAADDPRGAMRLLVHKTIPGFALGLEQIDGDRLAGVNCRLMVKNPDTALRDDMLLRFSLMPQERRGALSAWRMANFLLGSDGARIEHRRSLTFIPAADDGTFMILEYSVIAQKP